VHCADFAGSSHEQWLLDALGALHLRFSDDDN